MTLKQLCDEYVKEQAIAYLARIPQEVQERYAHLDLLNTVIAPNFRYIGSHGIGQRELERWQQTINDWAIYTKARAKVPLPGDRVVLTATGSIRGTTTVYDRALIEGKHHTGDLSICTQPMVPFLCDVDYVPYLSVSGGYFGHLPAEVLEFKAIAPAEFKFWGTTCQADGALYIQLPVYWWEVTTDKFY